MSALIDRLRASAMTHYREQRVEVASPSQLVDGRWCPGSFEGTVPRAKGDRDRSRCSRCAWISRAAVGNLPMRHGPKVGR